MISKRNSNRPDNFIIVVDIGSRAIRAEIMYATTDPFHGGEVGKSTGIAVQCAYGMAKIVDGIYGAVRSDRSQIRERVRITLQLTL